MSLSISYYLTTNLIIRTWTQVPQKYKSVPKTRDMALPTSWGCYTTPQNLEMENLAVHTELMSNISYGSQHYLNEVFPSHLLDYSTMTCIGRPLTKYTWKLHWASPSTATATEVNAFHCFQLGMPQQSSSISPLQSKWNNRRRPSMRTCVLHIQKLHDYLHTLIASSETKPQFPLYSQDSFFVVNGIGGVVFIIPKIFYK